MMRPRYWFWAYNNGSQAANLLVEALNGRFIKHENSKYRPAPQDVVISWGFGRDFPWKRVSILNNPAAINRAISKQRTFDVLRTKNIRCPESTSDQAVAQGWSDGGFRVLGRDQDHGMKGHGITVYEKGSKLKHHLFYVKYFKKEREFRVHVFSGKVIFEQEKLQKNGAKEEASYSKYIRSHERGWCFAFKHFDRNPVPQEVKEVGIKAIAALGLDFGGVDIGWNKKDGACVFEVNTAPGIEESSLQAYVNHIKTL